VVPDVVPKGSTVTSSLALVVLGHDYIRALGELDLAVNFPTLAS
jgi:hypothetical protein